ncbi:MAG: cytochrome c-type biogenesis protein [Myxococcota bacterium]
MIYVAVVGLGLVAGQSASAEPSAATETAAESVGQQDPARVETTQDEAYQIGLLLRCPVCQGMPIADSPATLAQNMMKRIRELLAEGKSRDEILDYFAATYGEKTLLRPKASGLNAFVWLLPPFGVLLAFGLVRRYVRGATQANKAAPRHNQPGVDNSAVDDAYVRAVRDEVGL